MEQGGLAIVQIEIVGAHDQHLLQSSKGEPARISIPRFGLNSMTEKAAPIVSVQLRMLPSDLWMTRRIRRVPTLLAVDHTAHTEVAALALS